MDGKERGGGFVNAEVGEGFLTQRGGGAEEQRDEGNSVIK